MSALCLPKMMTMVCMDSCSTFYDDLDTEHSKVETKTTKGVKTEIYACKYCGKGVSTKARFAEHLAGLLQSESESESESESGPEFPTESVML